jgi:hypothetical protein
MNKNMDFGFSKRRLHPLFEKPAKVKRTKVGK